MKYFQIHLCILTNAKQAAKLQELYFKPLAAIVFYVMYYHGTL